MINNNQIQEEKSINELDEEIKIYKKLTDIDLSNLDFKVPIRITKDSETIYYCETTKEILIQTPSVSVIKNIYNCRDQKALHINLKNEMLSDLILEIDNTIISKIQTNFKKWFKKTINFESILEHFIPSKLYTTDIESYMVLLIDDDLTIFNENQEILEDYEINSKDKYHCIIEFCGIYLEKSKFYTNWKLIQLKI